MLMVLMLWLTGLEQSDHVNRMLCQIISVNLNWRIKAWMFNSDQSAKNDIQMSLIPIANNQ